MGLAVAIALLLVVISPAECVTQESGQGGQSGKVADLLDTLARRLVHDGLMVVSAPGRIGRSDVMPLLALAGGLALAYSSDRHLRGEVQGRGLDSWDRTLNRMERLGRVQVVHGISGALFLTGHLTGDSRLARVGALGWESSFFTVMLTGFFKYALGRPRPFQNQDPRIFKPFTGKNSFPSSHASQAFSLATVLADEYGAGVGVGAYAGASLVALSRMRDDLHWASDVVAGAALGIFVARTICHLHPSDGSAPGEPALQLHVGPETGAVTLRLLVPFQ
jgi:acid phosphatase family membrane protein YuiD